MKLNDIRSDLFSGSFPPISTPLCRQSAARTRPVIVPSIENLHALNHKLSIFDGGSSPMGIHRRSNKPF
jgi:hypothetical protein